MRKYYLSLLIIDQRPSQIDNEILSQLGTKFLLSLTDPHDCEAVITGVEKAQHIKRILETLSHNQEIVIVGHTAPLPVKIKVADYNSLVNYIESEQKLTSEKIKQITDVIF